jgi:hypothetical protein
MNAVLFCIPEVTWQLQYTRKVLLAECSNHVGSGACGDAYAAANLNVVRRVLNSCEMHVHIFGCVSLKAFCKREVKSCGILGYRDGRAIGNLLWCEE